MTAALPHFSLPRLRDLARHAVPHAVEATLIPLALFYCTTRLMGVWSALIASLVWCYLGLGRRIIQRQRVPGLLLLAAAGLTARTIVAFVSGSVFIYFLQPTLTAVVVSGAFLLSVPAGRPLAKRLATDMFPLPESVLAHPAVDRIFGRITLLWGAINLVNAAITVVLLLFMPVETYVLSKAAITAVVMATGVLVSTLWFTRAIRTPAAAPAPLALEAAGS